MVMIQVMGWQVTEHLFLQIKFYWNMAISIHLDIFYGYNIQDEQFRQKQYDW